MKAIFVDVETTGKANFNAAPEADLQPRIVQLAAILCDGPKEDLAQINLIINTCINIPDEASQIHGITNARAKADGVPLFYALQVFWALAKHADVVVAHNIEFDWFVLEGESRRMVTDVHLRPKFCTMKEMALICKIPGRYDDFKWPRLSEAYRYAFNEDFDGAHDALADVRACKRLYFWLKDRPVPIPQSHIKIGSTGELAKEMRKAAQ